MKKILFFAALLLLSACADTDKMSKHIDYIEGEIVDEKKEIVEMMDSLRNIADAQQDTALYNALYDIANNVEDIIDFYNIWGSLEGFKEDCIK